MSAALFRKAKHKALYLAILGMFSNNVPGLVLDANDWGPTGTGGTGVVFQDLSGTPVTAMEQPVQLILDKSQGLALGTELTTNGGFVSDLSGWTSSSIAPATSSWVAGGLQLSTDGSQYAGEWQGETTVVGKWYKIQIVVSTGGASLQCRVGTTGGAGDVLSFTNYMTAAGTYNFYFLAVGTTSYVQVRTGSGGTCVIRSISTKNIAGNHAYVSASANRPTISARYSSFIKTEALDDANWIKYESTIDTTKYTAPDGTLTAQRLLATTVNNNHYIRQAVTVGGNGVLTFYAAPGGYNYCSIASNPNGYIHFDLTNGNVSTLGSGWASATCVPDRNGFYKITVTASAPQTWVNAIIYIDSTWIPSGATSPWSGAGDVTKGILLWHPDLRPSDQATGLIPTYQRVNTATDYDWSPAFPPMIRGNGSNQYLTGNLDLSSTNKVTVWAGGRKFSDASGVILFEHGANSGTVAGTFAMFAPTATNQHDYEFQSRGASAVQYVANTPYTAPCTNVVTGLADIAAPSVNVRVNGVAGTPVTASQGGGNYTSQPYYLLSRAGASMFSSSGFNTIIILGAAATAAQISTTEAYCNQKLRAYA